MGTIFVLTGGPCAGKSTLLAELERRGYPVIGEAATEGILEGKLHPPLDPPQFPREGLPPQAYRERHGRVIDLAWGPLADRVQAVLTVVAQEPRSAASDSRN